MTPLALSLAASVAFGGVFATSPNEAGPLALAVRAAYVRAEFDSALHQSELRRQPRPLDDMGLDEARRRWLNADRP